MRLSPLRVSHLAFFSLLSERFLAFTLTCFYQMSTRSPNQPELDQNLVQIPGMVDEISRSAVSTEDTLKIQPASGMEVRSTFVYGWF